MIPENTIHSITIARWMGWKNPDNWNASMINGVKLRACEKRLSKRGLEDHYKTRLIYISTNRHEATDRFHQLEALAYIIERHWK